MGQNEQNTSGQIGGVSLASFLQILEQEAAFSVSISMGKREIFILTTVS